MTDDLPDDVDQGGPEQQGTGAAPLVLGAEEIINYPLRKATRGYKTSEVDDLLDQLAVQTQELLAELRAVREERDRLRHQLDEANETESMLKKTLVTAQRTAEASVAEAREEADELRRRARERAEKLLADAAGQAHELREAALRRARADKADIRRYRRDVEEHIESLRTFAADHRARLAHHLELQQERLDDMELPDAPPPPQVVEDEILDDDVEEVDVQGMVDELAGADPDAVAPESSAPAAVPSHGDSDEGQSTDDDEGPEPDPASGAESDADDDGDAAPADTSERLFGA